MMSVQAEGMESLYEDLSLFNGDLLLEDVELPAAVLKPEQDGLVDMASSTEVVASKVQLKEILSHPQNGSHELGLVDLLASSPTSDLPDPLSMKSDWMDQNADLMAIISTEQLVVSQDSKFTVPTIEISFPSSPEAAVVPSTPPGQTPTADIESLEEIQRLLFMELKETPLLSSPGNDGTVDMLDLSDSSIDELPLIVPSDLIDESGTSLFEAPILSPVSANDVESILSSTSPSPAPQQTVSDSSTLLLSMCESPDDSDDPDYGPPRKKRSSQRPAPYTKPSGKDQPLTERKARKKAQNRSAAIRYREKKRSEMGSVQSEVDELQSRNRELKEKVDSMTREISYLKDLMAAVYKAKKKKSSK